MQLGSGVAVAVAAAAAAAYGSSLAWELPYAEGMALKKKKKKKVLLRARNKWSNLPFV